MSYTVEQLRDKLNELIKANEENADKLISIPDTSLLSYPESTLMEEINTLGLGIELK